MKGFLKAIGLVLLVALSLVGGVALGFSARLSALNPFGEESESSNSAVVRAIQRQEKVVLLSLGIQGLAEENIRKTLFGKEIPGTGRTTFLQYNYRAMLGIDGSDVAITKVGDKAYEVTIPEFIFIGSDDHEFKIAVENNGVLSWVTPEIDTTEMITKVLNDEIKHQHVHDNRELLQDQARAFYGGIITGIDQELHVEFKFVTTK